MKLEQLQIFHNLTEDEMQKSLVCSQAVVQKYQKNKRRLCIMPKMCNKIKYKKLFAI